MLARFGRRLVVPIGAIVLLALATFGGASGLRAQDASPVAEEGAARPIHIHAGSCPEVGEVVQPLTDLTAPEGEAAGQAAALQAEYSYTLVPMALDAMLAEDFAINVHESAENIGNYIACGDIGGVVDANGQLVIGLAEQNGSGFTGIAFLAPNPDDPNATDVSVFIAATQDEAAAAG
jgi:hypothetical protein